MGVAFQRACDERAAGKYAEAVQSFAEAAQRAHTLNDPHWEAKSLVYKGVAQARLFQYAAALETTEAAAMIARHAGEKEKELAAGAEGNTSAIYEQLGNFSLARQKLTQAIDDLKGSSRNDLLANAYLLLSYEQTRLGEVQAGIKSSDLSIKTAQQAKRPDLEAEAWDVRGTALLLVNQTAAAEKSLDTAVKIYRSAGKISPPAWTLEHLAELKWKEEQNQAALDYINRAFATADVPFKTSPQYYPLSVRAGILRDLGRTDEALNGYRKAIHSADLWRRAALPGDTTNIETVKQLQDTYQSFAELAATQSLMHHDDALAREAFEAIVQNRAASLREQLKLEMVRNNALPPDYLAKLGELQSIQARITLEDDAKSQDRLAQIEGQISEIEINLGLSSEKNSSISEKNSSKNSLRDIQSALSTGEVLLSFCLGEHQSFLWAVTNDAMSLYGLSAAKDIGEQARSLRDAVAHGQSFSRLANNLGSDIFSQLDAKFWNKPEWLIVGDGALLDRVPFSVLPTKDSKTGALLFATHSIRSLPSEMLLLSRSQNETESRFLGIGDPLYNLADSRRSQQTIWRNVNHSKGASALGRLPGSQREIRASAQHSGMAQKQVLIGQDANLQAVTAALQQHPAIIHFAVHVVSPPEHPEQAALALSQGPDNIPELLTREKIASLRVPGSLVVLSGCSSGQGQAAPGNGLLGLSRAWLLAGAEAVIVSNWPTPDDSGQFFTYFYSHLGEIHSGTLAQRAAAALQQAQLDTRRRGGYGSSASFWAAYSIISKE